MASRKRNKVTGESLEMTVGAAVNEATTGLDVTDLTRKLCQIKAVNRKYHRSV